MYRWLRDDGRPEGFQILCLSCNESKGTGERCTPPVTGTLALQDVPGRSQNNEENR